MEVEFFEKVRKTMPKATYNDFLKLLNMFSQEIIDVATLVDRARPFLARTPELFEFLKRLVKYEEEEAIYNIPAARPEVDLRACRRSGRSYRLLPSHIPRPTCSGREPSHQEVLNDDWTSHPVVQSEERDNSSNRYRNTFEEALHKAEDERYEFDLNIQSNLHVIALLEPIAKKIATYTAEEKAKMRLEEGLGGTSGTIYKRVIKKVYDGARGLEVLKLLHEHPAVTVPVVLKRLQQKDEEWKRAQREWQKVWRQIDSNNYQKALDYQSFSFKADDKKKTSPKSLLTEIENLAKEQEKKHQLRVAMGKAPAAQPDSGLGNRYHMRLGFKDPGVFEDVRRIISCGIDCMVGATEHDRTSIREYFDGFVNAIFGMMPASESESGTVNGGHRVADTDGMEVDEEGNHPGNGSEEHGKVPADGDARIEGDKGKGAAGVVPKAVGVKNQRMSFHLYGNQSFYVFFRLFHVSWERGCSLSVLTVVPPESRSLIGVFLGICL
ncbi:Transcriptional regulatory protein sin3 [Gonapodya sp. JEL0774]|nr:Transcriptional regulatory protein sin3 [Gonapodya sp. JEL0774]